MPESAEDFYSSWDDLYDIMIDWPRRLEHEIPLLTDCLSGWRARRVLDAACGSGRHATALAQNNFLLTGSDLNPKLLQRAREYLRQVQPPTPADFFEWNMARPVPDSIIQKAPFDAILCLGHSFPHLTQPEECEAALNSFFTLLRPGGRVLIQMKNLDRRKRLKDIQLPPLKRILSSGQTLFFLRFYDFALPQPDLAEFHLVVAGEKLLHQVTRHRIWTEEDFRTEVLSSGFKNVHIYGDLSLNTPFSPDTSEDLIAVLEKS